MLIFKSFFSYHAIYRINGKLRSFFQIGCLLICRYNLNLFLLDRYDRASCVRFVVRRCDPVVNRISSGIDKFRCICSSIIIRLQSVFYHLIFYKLILYRNLDPM